MRRSVRVACGLLVIVVGIAALLRAIQARRFISTVPLLTDAQGQILMVPVSVNGRQMKFAINTLTLQTVVRLSRAGAGAKPPTQILDLKLGNYARRMRCVVVPDRPNAAGPDGVLGNDFFEGVAVGSPPHCPSGVRITMDAAGHTMTVDTNPTRLALRPVANGIPLPLRRLSDGPDAGIYVASVKLNYAGSFDFAVGYGRGEVMLPQRSVWQIDTQQIDPSIMRYVPAIGMTPVVLNFPGREIPSMAIALPTGSPFGWLGSSFLNGYRVELDYRDRLLCLDPAR